MYVGHTHEDIDGCFGVLKRLLRDKHIMTLEEFRNLVELKLSKESFPWKVIDVMVIPDMHAVFESCTDAKLAKLHKELQTQHQWKFECVPVDPFFPLGCKTMYRAYSSDKVVEFVEKEKENCLSRIGRETGLEPIVTTSKWYPCKESSRGM